MRDLHRRSDRSVSSILRVPKRSFWPAHRLIHPVGYMALSEGHENTLSACLIAHGQAQQLALLARHLRRHSVEQQATFGGLGERKFSMVFVCQPSFLERQDRAKQRCMKMCGTTDDLATRDTNQGSPSEGSPSDGFAPTSHRSKPSKANHLARWTTGRLLIARFTDGLSRQEH